MTTVTVQLTEGEAGKLVRVLESKINLILTDTNLDWRERLHIGQYYAGLYQKVVRQYNKFSDEGG